MSKEKILKSLEKLIGQCNGASGRLMVTAMNGNKEVKEAMEMITNISIDLGMIAEGFEYNDKVVILGEYEYIAKSSDADIAQMKAFDNSNMNDGKTLEEKIMEKKNSKKR